MKKLLLLSLILIGCAKKTPEPTIQEPINNTVATKNIKVFVTYGSVNNFTSIKWQYDPSIDSGYSSCNCLSRTFENNINTDSIMIYTNSGLGVNDNIMVTVDGVIKAQYTGSQLFKKIKLN